jgi:Mannosyltransferase (PIG-V)
VLERLPAAVTVDSPRDRVLGWVLRNRAILGWWAASRAVVLSATLAVHWLREPRGYFGHRAFHAALGTLESWDGTWYRHVAAHGYLLVPGHQSDPAFFPLYPLLLKLVGASGMSTGAGGVALSSLLFLLGLVAFDALGRELFPHTLARRATLLAAVFPMSYVCSMVYPESLVFLAFALTGLFAVRRRWSLAAAAAAVAALARPEGVLLALPIAGVLATSWQRLETRDRGRGIAAVLAAPAAAASFPAYLGLALHDPFAWTKAEQAWGRSFRTDGILHAITRVGHEFSQQGWAGRDVGLCVLTLALVAVARRAGAPRTWVAVGALLVLLPLGTGSFESDGRFGLLALPAYWGLASLVRRQLVNVAVITLSLALLAAATVTVPLVFP